MHNLSMLTSPTYARLASVDESRRQLAVMDSVGRANADGDDARNRHSHCAQGQSAELPGDDQSSSHTLGPYIPSSLFLHHVPHSLPGECVLMPWRRPY
jgi:hypothetical protein